MLISFSAFAGPPFLTDDLNYPLEHQFQVYLFSMTADYSGNDNLRVPATELKWGLTPDIELKFLLPYITNIDVGKSAVSGFGDMAVGLGYRFHEETEYTPGIGFIPQVTIPTADSNNGIGNGKPITQLPVWFQKSIGDWMIDTGGGYNINHQAQKSSNAFGGFLLQNQITPKLRLGGEIYYQGKQSNSRLAYTVLNLGVTYRIVPSLSLMLSAGNSIAGQQNFISYLGIRWSSSV
ncbi:MAG: hypothetical protein HKM04_01490 [Legionellales bacterium]|nr:hypothetical protein [Legionellales bacterium]